MREVAQPSGVGFGGCRFLTGSFEGFLVGFELGFNFGSAPLGFAVSRPDADGPPERFE